jgi:hypothetical protein
MKRLISTAAFVVVFVVLGLLAAAAAPTRGTAPAAPAAAPIAPRAPAGTKWNTVTMALDATGELARSSDLLAAVPGARQVMRWTPAAQLFEVYEPGNPASDFTLQVGDPLFLLLDETAGSTFTLVGDVPPPGLVSFEMAGGSPCQWNHISLPLEMSAVTNAQQLAQAIRGTEEGAVEQLLRWDASIQNFVYWIPAPVGGPPGLGTNFETDIGYDYFVCLRADITWPQTP